MPAGRAGIPRSFGVMMMAWLAAGVVAASSAFGNGGFSVEGAWARASIGESKVSAVYLTLHNRGEAADRVVGAVVSRASRTMLHRSFVEDGIMRMRHVPAIEIPGGGTVRFEPGGLHVMLTGLRSPLEEGEEISVTLRLEREGEVVVSVPVRASAPR